MLYKTILAVHIVSGLSALVLGSIAILSKKGQKTHLLAGRWFLYVMLVSAFSAIFLTFIKPQSFLFSLGILTLYFLYGGRRAIAHYRKTESYRPNPWLDKVPVYLILAFAIYSVGRPLVFALSLDFANLLVRVAIGSIILGVIIFEFRFVRDDKNYIPKNPRWLLRHVVLICSAYFTTLSAFVITNVKLELWWIVWLAPPIFAVGAIGWMHQQWKKKLLQKPIVLKSKNILIQPHND